MIEFPLSMIRTRYNTLSSSQQKIANYILNNAEYVAENSINQLALDCGFSETTVLRLLKKLGFDSFKVFKVQLIKEISINSHSLSENIVHVTEDVLDYVDIFESDGYDEVVSKIVASTTTAITDLGKTLDKDVITKIVAVLSKSQSIIFFASGGSASVGLDMYHKFMRLAIPVFFDENNHLSLIRISYATPKDTVVLISRTGESREVLECAKVAKEKGCTVIGLTSFRNSSLASISDLCLYGSSFTSTFDMDSMISRLLQLVSVDIVYMLTKNLIGPSADKSVQDSRKVLLMTKQKNS